MVYVPLNTGLYKQSWLRIYVISRYGTQPAEQVEGNQVTRTVLDDIRICVV